MLTPGPYFIAFGGFEVDPAVTLSVVASPCVQTLTITEALTLIQDFVSLIDHCFVIGDIGDFIGVIGISVSVINDDIEIGVHFDRSDHIHHRHRLSVPDRWLCAWQRLHGANLRFTTRLRRD